MILDLKKQALELYKTVFSADGEEFAEEFINRFFDKNCRYTVVDGKLISMLFIFDCTLYTDEKVFPASYLYAAATLPEMRGKGEMRQLIERVKGEEKQRGRVIITKPASESLFSFYGLLGFKTAFYGEEYLYSVKGVNTPEVKEISPEEYYKKREELLSRTPHLTFEETKRFALGDMLLLGGEKICCAVELSGDVPIAYEFLSKTENGEEAVLNYIRKDKTLFRGKRLKTPFAMLWNYDENSALPDRMYMGLAME